MHLNIKAKFPSKLFEMGDILDNFAVTKKKNVVRLVLQEEKVGLKLQSHVPDCRAPVWCCTNLIIAPIIFYL